MKKAYLFWGLILVAGLSMIGLAVRALILEGLPFYDTLILRGATCFLFVFAFGRMKGLSLIPKSIRNEVFRALIAGLSLSLLTVSYKWLSASSVAVLTNIDVPLLYILGSWVGMKSSRRLKMWSWFSILILSFYVLSLERQEGLVYGILSLGTACVLLSFGYYFIKRSMLDENEAITILTPALAIFFYGIVEHLIAGAQVATWNSKLTSIAFIAGAGMFGAYYATMRLYEITDLVTAEFPTLISSVIIQPLEDYFLKTPMEWPYIISSVLFVLVLYRILLLQNHEGEMTSEAAGSA